MADDRLTTGSTRAEAAVHDDDELADVLAAELERYSTGTVPALPSRLGEDRPSSAAAPRTPPSAPPQQPPPPAAARAEQDAVVPATTGPGTRRSLRGEPDFARRASEVQQQIRRSDAADDGDPFRRREPATGRRSATGPLPQVPLVAADDLPVKRRSGFRPPPSALPSPVVEPIDRVLPTGPVTLPEPTATLLDAMIADSGPATEPVAAALPRVEPIPRIEAPSPLDVPATGALPPGSYAEWEQSLRSIGRPRPPWEQEGDFVAGGGDAALPTVALPVVAAPASDGSVRHGAHALPADAGALDGAAPSAPRRRRSGRRRADVPADLPATAEGEALVLRAGAAPTQATPPLDAPDLDPTSPDVAAPPRFEPTAPDVDDEGVDDHERVDYPVVSAATTGAIDLPSVEPRPRTGPVLIERVRTALLQLPAVPASPTGSGAAAIVGRWVGAFASPVLLVLAFALAGSGAGPAAGGAVALGALLTLPAAARSVVWAAAGRDDADLLETAVLGEPAGRVVAAALLLARLAAASAAILVVGSIAGSWADRTGALGLSGPTAALAGSTAAALLALLVAALPVRVTAVLVLLAAVAGAVGTALVAMVLAPNGSGSAGAVGGMQGGVAAAVAGFAAVGLVVVLCGPDVARWRTGLPRTTSSVVATVVATAAAVLMLAAASVIAARFAEPGDPIDGFASALADASASALATPLLLVLLASSLTLPALLLRSSGAAAARLVGGGRPVGLGAAASGLLALAGALAVLASGSDVGAVVLAIAAAAGVPVAAWAGLLVLRPAAGRSVPSTVGLAVAALAGWGVCDGLPIGGRSPVLDALGITTASGFRGTPAVGLAVAFVVGLVAGSLGRSRPPRTPGSADTVEG